MKKYLGFVMAVFLAAGSFSSIVAAQQTNLTTQNQMEIISEKENVEVSYDFQQYASTTEQTTQPIEPQEKRNIAANEYIPILMYHHFKTEEIPAGDGANMSIDEFEQHLKTLQQAGYTTIFLNDLNHIMQKVQQDKQAGVTDQGLHMNGKYIIITIDDGYRSNYELAYPLLQKYHMKASISVITSRIHHGYIYSSNEIEKMSWENLNEMQNSGLVEIFGHTYDHEPVGNRLYTDFRSSVLKGEEMLEKELEMRSPVKVLTYPNGNYTNQTQVLMRSMLGFDLQMTTNSGVVNRNTSILEIPRITVNSGWSGEQLLEKIEQAAQKTFQP